MTWTRVNHQNADLEARPRRVKMLLIAPRTASAKPTGAPSR